MYPHQIDENYVGSHLEDLRRTSECAQCKPRVETVFDRPSRIRIDLSQIIDLTLVIMVGFVVLLLLRG